MTHINYKNFREYENNSSALFEAWKSKNIMGYIDKADKNSKRAWYKSFTIDFYKKFNISIDKIKDSSFTKLDKPEDFFKSSTYRKNPDTYLAIFINDDKNLQLDAENFNSRLLTDLKTAIKNKSTKTEIEHIKAQIDKMKQLDVPFLVAIVMGQRVVYHGFKEEDEIRFGTASEELPYARKTGPIQYGAPHKALRYGINPAMWLQTRYFGLEKGDKVTAKNTAERSTIAYVVNIGELKQKYGMGDKLKDRADSKVDNSFFISDAEFAANNRKRYKLMMDNKLDPKSILAMFKESIVAYTDYYLENIKILDEGDFNSFLNRKINIDDSDVIGLSTTFTKFDSILKRYFKSYKEYMKFLKNSKDVASKIKTKKATKQQLDAEEDKYNTKLNDYMLDLISLKKEAESLKSDLQKAGVKY